MKLRVTLLRLPIALLAFSTCAHGYDYVWNDPSLETDATAIYCNPIIEEASGSESMSMVKGDTAFSAIVAWANTGTPWLAGAQTSNSLKNQNGIIHFSDENLPDIRLSFGGAVSSQAGTQLVNYAFSSGSDASALRVLPGSSSASVETTLSIELGNWNGTEFIFPANETTALGFTLTSDVIRWQNVSALRVEFIDAGGTILSTQTMPAGFPGQNKRSLFFGLRTERPEIAMVRIILVGTNAQILGLDELGFAANLWRSSLYPKDWYEGYTDSNGYGLLDFSYAGYHSGEQAYPPDVSALTVLDVTQVPYSADPTGTQDSTQSIQQAIDDAGSLGGAIVYLPEGTYRVSPQQTYYGSVKRATLQIKDSGVVVRGDGPDKTFVLNADPMMRFTAVFHISETIYQSGPRSWFNALNAASVLSYDPTPQDTAVYLNQPGGFQVNDWIVIREDVTQDFVDSFGITPIFTRLQALNLGQALLRKVVAIEDSGTTLVLDMPIQASLSHERNIQVHKVADPLEEVGIDNLSIGMLFDPTVLSVGETRKGNALGGSDAEDWLYRSRNIAPNDWDQQLNAASSVLYSMHGSYLINMDHVVNSWIDNVHTYQPSGNNSNVHLLSNGFGLNWCRQITASNCVIANALFVGGGGNGYGISFGGQNCLVTNITVERMRRPISHRFRSTRGNVVFDSTLTNSIGADWHMWLSPGNLMDCITLDKCIIEARFRGADHGYSTTESVIWNTTGHNYRTSWYAPDEDFIIDSCQYGKGYIIGTAGIASTLRVDKDGDTVPDWVEGVGQGNTLVPQSLYLDQLTRRLQAKSAP